MSNKAALIIFVKNPELGKVKTRLAEGVGQEMALLIYKELLAHTKAVSLAVDVDRFLFYSNEINWQDDWSKDHFQKQLQFDGGLGERMSAAFKTAFENKNAPVLIIGSDCAQLQPSIIEEALSALQDKEFVIGPAKDGGYYLIGMQKYHPEVFENIVWSTEQVFKDTIAIIEQHQWSYHCLATLSDIDYKEDWETYGWPIAQEKYA